MFVTSMSEIFLVRAVQFVALDTHIKPLLKLNPIVASPRSFEHTALDKHPHSHKKLARGKIPGNAHPGFQPVWKWGEVAECQHCEDEWCC